MKANKQLLLMQIHIFTDKADCFSWSFKIQTCISWIYSPLFTEVQKWQFFLFIFFVSAFSLVNIRCLLSKQKNKSMWCLHFCHCICDNSKPKSVLGQPQSLFSTWRKIAPDKKKKKKNPNTIKPKQTKTNKQKNNRLPRSIYILRPQFSACIAISRILFWVTLPATQQVAIALTRKGKMGKVMLILFNHSRRECTSVFL